MMGKSAVKPFGVNLLSSFTKHYSITYVAYSLAESLLGRGGPISLVDVRFDQTAEVRPVPAHLSPYLARSVAEMRHPITVHAMPAMFLPEVLARNPVLRNPNTLQVANLWWEFPGLPAVVAENLWRFDAVLTHSDFVANLATAQAPGTHVINAPLRWRVDVPAATDRARFGLRPTGTAFLFVFDADSESGTIDPLTGHGRKNPLELIEVFRTAFPGPSEDVQLVIRATNIEKPAHAALKARLEAACRDDGRIRILSGHLPFAELMGLTASCDAYVSLHRGEGLGLGMLEAMALGKPVIASAWSGNLSFMNLTNSCPVRCRLVPLRPEYRYFGFELPPGTLWAEPIKEEAAAVMRHLHHDRPFREAVGRRARAGYETHQAAAQSETWIDELQALYAIFPHRPRVTGKYSSP